MWGQFDIPRGVSLCLLLMPLVQVLKEAEVQGVGLVCPRPTEELAAPFDRPDPPAQGQGFLLHRFVPLRCVSQCVGVGVCDHYLVAATDPDAPPDDLYALWLYAVLYEVILGPALASGHCHIPPPPPCISYALVQATVGVGTVIIWYVI